MTLFVGKGELNSYYDPGSFYKDFLFYDIELATKINDIEGYKISESWKNFDEIELACIGFYSGKSGYQVIYNDGFKEFENIANSHSEIIGFNSMDYHDNLLASKGIKVKTTYDLFRRIVAESLNVSPSESLSNYLGYDLFSMSKVNLDMTIVNINYMIADLWAERSKRCVAFQSRKCVEAILRLFQKKNTLKDPINGNYYILPDSPLELAIPGSIKLS